MEPKKLYNKVAGIYDKRHESPSSLWLRRHEDRIVKKLKGRTIDIGCGTGHHLALLDDAIGVDPSAKMLEIASKTGKKVVLGEAESMPFPDASFDNALCLFCVLNLCDAGEAVAEMSRVLKRKGTAVVSVASVWDRNHNILKKISIRYPAKDKVLSIDGNRMHLRLFEKKELAGIFGRNGMELVKFKPLFKFQSPRWGSWSKLSLWQKIKLQLDALPFLGSYGAMYIVVFRKVV